mgnify:FL=1
MVRHWLRLPREAVDAPLQGVQGQAGWGPGQPGLVGGNTAHGRGGDTKCSLMSLPTQAILWFSDSVMAGTHDEPSSPHFFDKFSYRISRSQLLPYFLLKSITLLSLCYLENARQLSIFAIDCYLLWVLQAHNRRASLSLPNIPHKISLGFMKQCFLEQDLDLVVKIWIMCFFMPVGREPWDV